MADPIVFSALQLTGRLAAPDPMLPRLSATYPADFRTDADVTLEFTAINQQGTFGVPRSIFMDNGSNPSEVAVTVSGTQDRFTVPAFAEGFFHVECAANSSIRFVTVGGASDLTSTIIIYNWEVPPSVWYRFGAFNFDHPLMVEGTQPTGTDMDDPTTYNRPLLMAGVTAAGALTRLLTDAAGAIITGGGSVFGPDAVGVAPTHPPVLNGVLDSAGHVIDLQLNADGDLPVSDRVLDAWNDGSRAKVNPIAGQAGVAAGTGAVDVLTQRVTQASRTIVNRSIAAATGASQDMLTANQSTGYFFVQAPSTNVGTFWIDLSGGVAAIGTGVPILPGGYAEWNFGNINKITCIGTAGEKLTVYAG